MIERAIRDLASAFDVAATLMLGAILSFLGGRSAIQEALDAVDEIAEALEEDSREWAKDTIPEVYAEGMRTAMGSESTPNVPPEELEREVHDESIDLFIEELISQLAQATQNISAQAKGEIREIARVRLATSLDNGTNARDEAARMEKDLRERGVKFIDRRGRKWGPREYAEMVLRTHTIEVSNEANLNTSAELGSPGVLVSDGGLGDVDEPCKVANGQYWSLRYARLNRTEHPNCRRAFAPLPRDWDGELDRA